MKEKYFERQKYKQQEMLQCLCAYFTLDLISQQVFIL